MGCANSKAEWPIQGKHDSMADRRYEVAPASSVSEGLTVIPVPTTTHPASTTTTGTSTTTSTSTTGHSSKKNSNNNKNKNKDNNNNINNNNNNNNNDNDNNDNYNGNKHDIAWTPAVETTLAPPSGGLELNDEVQDEIQIQSSSSSSSSPKPTRTPPPSITTTALPTARARNSVFQGTGTSDPSAMIESLFPQFSYRTQDATTTMAGTGTMTKKKSTTITNEEGLAVPAQDDSENADTSKGTTYLHHRHLRNLRNVFAVPLAPPETTWAPPYHHKDEKEIAFIRRALENSFVFSTFLEAEKDEHDEESLDILINAFELIFIQQAGTAVMNQGDVADYFYIVSEGQCCFLLDGTKIEGKIAAPGDSFGEIALLYTIPRAATVQTMQDFTVLYRVDQKTFRFILQTQVKNHQNTKVKLLKSIPFIRDLAHSDITKLSSVMVPNRFKAGRVFMRKGDAADYFYILQEGTVKAIEISDGNATYEDVILNKPGDYFGEQALITGQPRNATIVAESDGLVFYIDKSTFQTILGNLQDLVLRSQDKRKIAAIKIIADAHFDDQCLTALSKLTLDRSYPAGTEIMLHDIPTEAALYLVRKGKVEILNPSGKMETIMEGGYFGDIMLSKDSDDNMYHTHTRARSFQFAKMPAPFTAVVLEDAICGVLPLARCRTVVDTYRFGRAHGKNPLRDSIHDRPLNLNELNRHRILGAGTFGQVWLVSRTSSSREQKTYALKVQSKYELYKEGQARAVVDERNIMSKLDCPFLIGLFGSCQDKDFVYMLVELIQGGELYSVIHSGLVHGLHEIDARFYAAGVAEGLSYMHRRNYVYRDLKPENVLINSKGYPVIIDFGFAKRVEDKTFTLCGTPLYLPPEVILNRGHNGAADHWSLGILIFEMLTGDTPFYRSGMDQTALLRAICKGKYSLPMDATADARRIISEFLVRDPKKRLGSLAGGEDDIAVHEWFSLLDFDQLRQLELKAPFVPKIKNPLDTSNFEDWSSLKDKTSRTYPKLTAKQERLFEDF